MHVEKEGGGPYVASIKAKNAEMKRIRFKHKFMNNLWDNITNIIWAFSLFKWNPPYSKELNICFLLFKHTGKKAFNYKALHK